MIGQINTFSHYSPGYSCPAALIDSRNHKWEKGEVGEGAGAKTTQRGYWSCGQTTMLILNRVVWRVTSSGDELTQKHKQVRFIIATQ